MPPQPPACRALELKYRMIRAQLAAAAIVFGATVAVTLLGGRAQAQTQPAPAVPSVWDHNGSTMTLIENGATREFHYQNPRPGMAQVGAHPGTLLFRGRFDNGQFSGTAYIFNPRCGPIPFPVKGSALDDGERIVLTGQVPVVGRKCRVYRTVASSLEFTRSKPAEAAPPQESPAAAPATVPAPDSSATEPEAPPQAGSEPASPPATQPSATKETPSPAKKPSRRAAERREPRPAPAAPPAEPSVTNKIPSVAKDFENCRSGVVLIVIIAALFGFTLVTSLRRTVFARG